VVNVTDVLTVLQFQNNARRDNLEGFWSQVYGTSHAVMWVDSFFENVPTHLFEKRDLAEGEKKPTPSCTFSRIRRSR
jgi:hypothetical protein